MMSGLMIRAVCFCNTWIESDASIAVCPKCGKYVTTLSVTTAEAQDMRDELDYFLKLMDLDLL